MTRRGSRDEGRTPTGSRPAASWATPAIPADAPRHTCACGAMYRDHPDSMAAHLTVFGHRPIRKSEPATAESAPENDQEGQEWTG